MTAQLKRKVGIISCSGEEICEGTVSRVATRLVLEKLCADRTVTLCLPLFLAGGQDERSFAKNYPTVAVDGCGKLCAAKATATYSAEPAAQVVVTEVAKRFPDLKADSRRNLGEAGMELAYRVAEEIAARVDELLSREAEVPQDATPAQGTQAGACSCQGGGVPTKAIMVAGAPVEVVGMQSILARFHAADAPEPELKAQILKMAKIYNYVPSEQESAYAEALWREFVSYRADEDADG